MQVELPRASNRVRRKFDLCKELGWIAWIRFGSKLSQKLNTKHINMDYFTYLAPVVDEQSLKQTDLYGTCRSRIVVRWSLRCKRLGVRTRRADHWRWSLSSVSHHSPHNHPSVPARQVSPRRSRDLQVNSTDNSSSWFRQMYVYWLARAVSSPYSQLFCSALSTFQYICFPQLRSYKFLLLNRIA